MCNSFNQSRNIEVVKSFSKMVCCDLFLESQSFLYGAVTDRFLESALDLTESARDSYKMAPRLQSQVKKQKKIIEYT